MAKTAKPASLDVLIGYSIQGSQFGYCNNGTGGVTLMLAPSDLEPVALMSVGVYRNKLVAGKFDVLQTVHERDFLSQLPSERLDAPFVGSYASERLAREGARDWATYLGLIAYEELGRMVDLVDRYMHSTSLQAVSPMPSEAVV